MKLMISQKNTSEIKQQRKETDMNPNMLNKLKKMQKQMLEAQEQLESKEFYGKASGVTVIVQGTKQLIDVQIDTELLTEVELLQDAIVMATNDALKQIEKETEETMGQFAGGMGGFGF
jgi:nucleoid-associated protein EbfC